MNKNKSRQVKKKMSRESVAREENMKSMPSLRDNGHTRAWIHLLIKTAFIVIFTLNAYRYIQLSATAPLQFVTDAFGLQDLVGSKSHLSTQSIFETIDRIIPVLYESRTSGMEPVDAPTPSIGNFYHLIGPPVVAIASIVQSGKCVVDAIAECYPGRLSGSNINTTGENFNSDILSYGGNMYPLPREFPEAILIWRAAENSVDPAALREISLQFNLKNFDNNLISIKINFDIISGSLDLNVTEFVDYHLIYTILLISFSFYFLIEFFLILFISKKFQFVNFFTIGLLLTQIVLQFLSAGVPSTLSLDGFTNLMFYSNLINLIKIICAINLPFVYLRLVEDLFTLPHSVRTLKFSIGIILFLICFSISVFIFNPTLSFRESLKTISFAFIGDWTWSGDPVFDGFYIFAYLFSFKLISLNLLISSISRNFAHSI
jgi:hypothetical protein